MNFLAHIYLSGSDSQIQVGNFIGDWVKGRAYEKYPEKIKKGIILHRSIDSFTDTHSVYRRSRAITAQVYGKYAGVVTDIFYDHFMAVLWHQFSDMNLNDFSQNFYTVLYQHNELLPPQVQKFLPFFKASNRLLSYQTENGIKIAVEIMSQRTSLPDFTEKAMILLRENYDDYKNDFRLFFPEIIKYCQIKLNEL